MILFAAGLLAFAIADLVRWHPTKVGQWRSVAAIAAGAGSVTALAALTDAFPCSPLLAGVVAVLGLLLWVGLDYLAIKPGWAITYVLAVLIALFACSGSAEPIGGSLQEWYGNLGFRFVQKVSVEEFTLALTASLFLLATTNRIVRLVLDAALPGWKQGESALKGGRVLGPLERVIIGAIVLAGDPAAAALVIAAKGLLRFPEIKEKDGVPGPDAITEYFLIGTLTSLLIAAIMAILVAGVG